MPIQRLWHTAAPEGTPTHPIITGVDLNGIVYTSGRLKAIRAILHLSATNDYLRIRLQLFGTEDLFKRVDSASK